MRPRRNGFSLIEVLIAVGIVAILAGIAYPSYKRYVVRVSREAAESQVMELANLQEKIFLNSSLYSGSITSAYSGASGGGLGVPSGKTQDLKYTLSVAPTTPAVTFTITATPIAGTTQEGDGNISINQAGQRLWNGVAF